MNEVIISAGKSGRLNFGYHFTEKENQVLDKIEKLDFGAANVFEFWRKCSNRYHIPSQATAVGWLRGGPT